MIADLTQAGDFEKLFGEPSDELEAPNQGESPFRRKRARLNDNLLARLSLDNEAFGYAVAKLASPMHQRSMRDLWGEDLRQHVRLRQVFFAGIALLLLTTAVSTSFAILFNGERQIALEQALAAKGARDVARDQKNIATSLRIAADKQTAIAKEQREKYEMQARYARLQSKKAEEQAKRADAEAEIATRQSTYALRQKEIAETRRHIAADQRTRARGRQLAAQAVAALDDTSDTALLLASEAHHIEPGAESIDALHKALSKRVFFAGYLHGDDSGTRLAFSRNSQRLASGTRDGRVALWNLHDRVKEQPIGPKGKDSRGLDFSPDGQWVANLDDEERLAVFPITRPSDARIIQAGWGGGLSLDFDFGSAGFANGSCPLAFSPDSKRIAYVNKRMKLEVLELSAATHRTEYLEGAQDATSRFSSIAWAADGKTIAACTESSILVWDVGTQEKPRIQLKADGVREFNDIAFLEARYLLAVSDDGQLLLWSTSDWQVRAKVKAHEVSADHLAVHSASRTILTGGHEQGWSMVAESSTVGVWKLDAILASYGEPAPAVRLPVEGKHVFSLALDKTGSLIAVGTEQRSIQLWNLRDPSPIVQTLSQAYPDVRPASNSEFAPSRTKNSVLFVATGNQIAEATTDGTVNVAWPPKGYRGTIPILNGVTQTPDERLLVLRSKDTIVYWDKKRNKVVRTIAPEKGVELWGPVVVGDSWIVSSASTREESGAIERTGHCYWDLSQSPPKPRWLQSSGWGIRCMVATDVPEQVVTGTTYDHAEVAVWNLSSVIDPGRHLYTHAEVQSLAFDHKSRYLYSSHYRGDVFRTHWSGAFNRTEAFLAGEAGKAVVIAVSPDGRILAAGNDKGEVSMWATTSRRRIGPFIRLAPVSSKKGSYDDNVDKICFSPDGKCLFVSLDNGSLFKINLNGQELDKIALRVAGRRLTADERRQFRLSGGDGSQLPKLLPRRKTSVTEDSLDGFIEKELKPLKGSQKIRHLAHAIISGNPSDDQILQSYAEAVKELPLLLSGKQVEPALKTVSLNEQGAAAAIVVVGLAGDINYLPSLLSSVKGRPLTKQEARALLWAKDFLAARGRDLSMSAFVRKLDRGDTFTVADFLAWPRGLEKFMNWNSLSPKKGAPWQELPSGTIHVGHLSSLGYHYLDKGDTVARALTTAGELLAETDAAHGEGLVRAALKLAPRNATIHHILGIVLEKRQRPNEAISAYKQSIALGRKDGWPEYNIAFILYNRSDYQSAGSYFRAALAPGLKYRRESERAIFLNANAWFILQTNSSGQAELLKARELCKQANEIGRESNAFHLSTLASIEYKLGHYAEAIRNQRKAVELLKQDDQKRTEYMDRLQEYEKKGGEATSAARYRKGSSPNTELRTLAIAKEQAATVFD